MTSIATRVLGLGCLQEVCQCVRKKYCRMEPCVLHAGTDPDDEQGKVSSFAGLRVRGACERA